MKIAHRINMPELLVRFILLAVAVSIILSAAHVFNKQVLADAISWTGSQDPTFSEDAYQPGGTPPSYNNCTPAKRYLSNNRTTESDNKANICLVEKDGWSYGKYSYVAPFSSTVQTGYAISFGGEEKVYRVENFNPTNAYDIPGTNAVLDAWFSGETSTALQPLIIYPNIRERLTRETFGNYGVRYVYDYTNDDRFILKRPNGTQLTQSASAVSDNGQWVVTHVPGVGLLRINTQTFDVKRFSQFAKPPSTGPLLYMDISDDGKHAVLSGSALGTAPGFRLYNIDENCGDVITNATTDTTPVANLCPEKNIDSFISGQFEAEYKRSIYTQISPDGGEIYSYAIVGNGEASRWVTLTAPGYNPPVLTTWLLVIPTRVVKAIRKSMNTLAKITGSILTSRKMQQTIFLVKSVILVHAHIHTYSPNP